nr:uncharacterized protein LOC109782615 isoform X2 [Aegilops tauschii subsp. strangulata]
MRLSTDGLSSGDSSDATRLACVSGGGGVHLLPGAAVVAWDTAGSAAKMDFSGGAFENVDMSTNPRLCSSTLREGSRCRCSSTRRFNIGLCSNPIHVEPLKASTQSCRGNQSKGISTVMPVHPTVHAQLRVALQFASNLAST